MEAEVKGLKAFSAGHLAGQHTAALITAITLWSGLGTIMAQCDGHRSVVAVARTPLEQQPGPVGTSARDSVSIHRNHGGMDDR